MANKLVFLMFLILSKPILSQNKFDFFVKPEIGIAISNNSKLISNGSYPYLGLYGITKKKFDSKYSLGIIYGASFLSADKWSVYLFDFDVEWLKMWKSNGVQLLLGYQGNFKENGACAGVGFCRQINKTQLFSTIKFNSLGFVTLSISASFLFSLLNTN